MGRTAAIYVFVLGLSGCASPAPPAGDSYFGRVWSQDARNGEFQSIDQYLAWVASFYEGSPLVPGWKRRQADLCASLDPAEARIAEPQLECLGRLLSSEWAKDNRCRRVGSDLLQLWAAVLREAREEGRLIEGLDAVMGDVRAILSGDLPGAAVTGDRYARLAASR